MKSSAVAHNGNYYFIALPVLEFYLLRRILEDSRRALERILRSFEIEQKPQQTWTGLDLLRELMHGQIPRARWQKKTEKKQVA